MTVMIDHRERFGRFELRRFVGRGATGDVHLAFDPVAEREVALKLVRVEAADPDALAAERKGAELQRRVAVEVPQVADVFEFGDHDGYFYIAMEFVDGVDLARVLAAAEDEPIEPERAVRIAVQLCEILEGLHRFSARLDDKQIRAVVHGDLKPENIRLEGGDRVRLVDFGIAKQLTQTRKATRNLFGTYPYTPPERLRSGLVDAGSDLWAVGIVLYVMVSGLQPYPGRSSEELERMILSRPPNPLPAFCPPAIRDVLERCLAFDPERRIRSAAELRRELERLLGDPTALEPGEPVGAVVRHPRSSPAAEGTGGATSRTGAASGSDATQRTIAPDSSLTVRTHRSPPPPPPPIEPAAPVVPPPPPAISRPDSAAKTPPFWRRRPLLAFGAVFLAVQFCAQQSADDLVESVSKSPEPKAFSAWRSYRAIAFFVPFDVGLSRARETVHVALLERAERVLHSFRQDIPSTRLSDWEEARRCLRAALEIDPEDDQARAKLLYVQAHIDRIRAKSLERHDREQAERRWNDAIFNFEQAATISPDWADPYLGLARIYAYERFDLARLLEALREARRRGVPWGKRELAQLADANRVEGGRLLALADELRGGRGEAQLLLDARRHLESAVAGYERILSFGNARENRDQASARLEAISERLRELRRQS